MGGSVQTSNFNSPRTGAAWRPSPLAPEQREALIDSSDMLRDRFTRGNDALTKLNRTLADPHASPISRGLAIAQVSRDLGKSLDGAGALQGQLRSAFATPDSYQKTAKGASGKAFTNTTRPPTRVVLPALNTAGALADLTLSQTNALKDFTELQRTLIDPNSSAGMKLAAAAKATQSASSLVTRQQALIRAIREADANYLQNPTYQRLTQEMRSSGTATALAKLDQMFSPRVMRGAQMAGSAGGIVMGVLTLPKLVESVTASYKQLRSTLYDSTATDEKRLDAIADFSRASAGTIQGVKGVHMALGDLTEIARSSKTFGGFATRVESIGFVARSTSWISGLLRVLTPIADMGMLVADLVKLKHSFSDPKATFWTQVRMGLNVGLDALKLGSWLLPQTAMIRMFYMGTSFAQLGLTVFDFGQTFLQTHGPKAEPVQPPPSSSLGSGLQQVGRTLADSAKFVSEQVQAPSAPAAQPSS